MLEDSTGRLLSAIRNGHPEALGSLLKRHLAWLAGWARGRLPVTARSGVDTQDLVQDTLLAAISNLAQFSPRHTGAFRAYLRKSVRNRVCDEVRRASNRRRFAGEVNLDDLPSPACSPLDSLLGKETAERYAFALSALTPPQQLAVVSRFEMHYSYEQVAEVLGKRSAEAARKAVARSLTRLAEEMCRVDPASRT
jgi:RNA polymerase sigma-70 factor, ECF subfamily